MRTKSTFLLSLLFLFLSAMAFSQARLPVVIGHKQGFYSKQLNENRQLWIYTPDQTAYTPDLGRKYPVLYVLDGDAHFCSVVGMVQQLSQANNLIPEMIVVGLPNTNRTRDLVPSSRKDSNFISFLEQELFPYIETNYPAAPYRTLIGHSLGGLLAIDILAQRPELFHSYIAIDASLWYNNLKFAKAAQASLPKPGRPARSLFLGIANTVPEALKGKDFQQDRTFSTLHIRSLFDFDRFLAESKPDSLRYAKQYYEKETHSSVPLICTYDGLRFIFDFYPSRITEKEYLDTGVVFPDRFRQYYRSMSEQMGYAHLPTASSLRYLAFEALGKRQYAKAEAFFRYHMEAYPSSYKALEDYGDYLLNRKDTAKALEWYAKALDQRKDTGLVVKVRMLRGGTGFTVAPATLQDYAGYYLLEGSGVTLQIYTKEGKLWTKVPGQADGELLPLARDLFTSRDNPSYRTRFHRTGKRITGFRSDQPNGIFNAQRK